MFILERKILTREEARSQNRASKGFESLPQL